MAALCDEGVKETKSHRQTDSLRLNTHSLTQLFSRHITALFCTKAALFIYFFSPGMNAAVRAVVRMGLYVGAKVYFIHEVSLYLHICLCDTCKYFYAVCPVVH